MNDPSVECYIVDDTDKEIPFEDYFKNIQEKIEWANKIEARALSIFYNKEIKII